MGSSRDGGKRGFAFLAGLALLALVGSTANAADIETRDFMVFVGGKPAGEVHMTIHRQDNGSILMRCDTDIKVKVGVVEQKYIYRGLEVWKDHRLVKFDSSTDDNGKRFIVAAVADKDNIRVKVNNVERTVPSHTWLSSYWCLPDPKLRGQQMPILDADNGKELSGKLQFVANEKVKLSGQLIALNHYRITGKVAMDLWYDGSDRLVRQEWVEQGHKMLVELARVRR